MEDAKDTESTRDRRQTPRGRADKTRWESPDTSCEVATVLLSKRWERRDRPFQGFDSPPGKF